MRLEITLAREVANALRTLAARRGTSITTAISRAVGTERCLRAASRRGAKILMKDGATLRQIILR